MQTSDGYISPTHFLDTSFPSYGWMMAQPEDSSLAPERAGYGLLDYF
jgi:hypothetical protein